MTYLQTVCETCSVVLREGTANKIVGGGFCKQEEERQFLVWLCVVEDYCKVTKHTFIRCSTIVNVFGLQLLCV
jgi:hypothetical protein